MFGNSQNSIAGKVSSPIAISAAADCLLVVDHDEANIQCLHEMLENLGFELFSATDGPRALAILAARRPDIILLNLLSPAMDGIELCKQIQETPGCADIPIVFFSSTHHQDLVVRALEGGGVDYLAQPFNKAELLSRLRTHLMLKTARDHLRQMAREKDELLGIISHYLQNHLAGMEMSAELLLDNTRTSGDPKLRLMAANIRSSSSQMRVFIKELLANAAADRGFAINLDSVNLADVALDSLRQYDEAARRKEITLHAHVPDEDILVHADAAALDQVLDNILSNAVKFSPPKKAISLTVLRSNGHVECRVQDQGPGFTEEDKLRMFQRYARLSARPSAGEPSNGLGLSIAKKLVHAMNGELTCQSSVGQGATFILRFSTPPGDS